MRILKKTTGIHGTSLVGCDSLNVFRLPSRWLLRRGSKGGISRSESSELALAHRKGVGFSILSGCSKNIQKPFFFPEKYAPWIYQLCMLRFMICVQAPAEL